jgi:uncharacterized protein YkwD
MSGAARLAGIATLALAAVAAPVSAAPARQSQRAPAHAAACTDAGLQAYPGNLERVARAVVCEVNLRRQSAGLAPLRAQSQLDRAAQFHTDDMVESRFVAHYREGHPALLTRIRRTGYFAHATGGLYTENIAVAPQEKASAANVVEAWMLSDDHREKILFGSFRDIGVGLRVTGPDPVFYADRPSVVFTTDFATRYTRRCGFHRATNRTPRSCRRRERR